MYFQYGLLISILYIFKTLTAIPLASDEIVTKPDDLASKVNAIKNQLKQIENEVIHKYENEKLQWQIETFQKWFKDDTKNQCSQDLSYIFDGWTAIQRRMDGSVDFYRNWTEYQNGFGDPNKEFFIGFEKLHKLTNNNGAQELLVLLGDHDNNIAYAKYDKFVVGTNTEKYNLKELGKYTGTAGDALRHQVGNKFTTLDEDNDNSKVHNCAKLWKGAWWFGYCYESHLNGPYLAQPLSEDGQKGIVWDLWHTMEYSLKFTLMLVRQKP